MYAHKMPSTPKRAMLADVTSARYFMSRGNRNFISQIRSEKRYMKDRFPPQILITAIRRRQKRSLICMLTWPLRGQ